MYLICAFFSSLWGYVEKNNDVQLWVTEVLDVPLTSRVNFALSNEWRIGHDISELYYFYLQGVPYFSFNEHVKLGPGYRQIWHLREDNRWRLEEQPLFDLIFQTSKGNLEFQLRNRFDYTFREADIDFFEYRARARILSQWEAWGCPFSTYLSNEIFVRNIDGFSQDRILVGMVIPLFKHLSGDFYGMLRYQISNNHWIHQYIFGTWFNLLF